MVKLISYNIEYCEGIPGKWYQYLKFWKIFFPPKNLDQRIIAALKKVKPDILALIENKKWLSVSAKTGNNIEKIKELIKNIIENKNPYKTKKEDFGVEKNW